MEPPGAEIMPEQETEPEQGAEHNQPVDRLAVTRPGRERRQPSYLKDFKLFSSSSCFPSCYRIEIC